MRLTTNQLSAGGGQFFYPSIDAAKPLFQHAEHGSFLFNSNWTARRLCGLRDGHNETCARRHAYVTTCTQIQYHYTVDMFDERVNYAVMNSDYKRIT